MSNPILYIREWNLWRKRNMNGKFHHFLVLIGFIHSPTFEALRGCFNAEEEIQLFFKKENHHADP